MKSQIHEVFDEFIRNINIFLITLYLKEGYRNNPVDGDRNVTAGFGPSAETRLLGKSVEVNNLIRKSSKHV